MNQKRPFAAVGFFKGASVAVSLCLGVVTAASAQDAKASGPLLEVNEKGREIVFNGQDGQKVKAKPSGSRTTITIAGKDAKREDLKAGMVCDVSYKAGSDEPGRIECK